MWNTLLVVIAPTEIVEQSGGQLAHHSRDGVHAAHAVNEAPSVTFQDFRSQSDPRS